MLTTFIKENKSCGIMKNKNYNTITLTQTINLKLNNNYDILILGMGPIGLMLSAILLDRYKNIKILIVDSRVNFNYIGLDDTKHKLNDESIEGTRQPFTLDISILSFSLGKTLNGIVSNELKQMIKNLSYTFDSSELQEVIFKITQNNGMCKTIITLYNYLLNTYTDRIDTYYTTTDMSNILKRNNSSIILDCTGGRSKIVNNDIDNSIFKKIKYRGDDNDHHTLISSDDGYMKGLKVSIPYSLKNYFFKEIDVTLDHSKYLNKMDKLDETTKNYFKNLYDNYGIIHSEKNYEIYFHQIEISKKNIAEITTINNTNYINILCGSGLIKSSPENSQTINLGINIFIISVLPEFDNIFELHHNNKIDRKLLKEKTIIFKDMLKELLYDIN